MRRMAFRVRELFPPPICLYSTAHCLGDWCQIMAAYSRAPVKILSDVCNSTLVWLMILAIPGLGLSLLRILETGWMPNMGVHILLFSYGLFLTGFRHRLSLRLRAWGIIGISLAIGAGEHILFGTPYGFVFFVSSGIMAAVLFGERVGITVLAGVLLAVIGKRVAEINGLLPMLPMRPVDGIQWMIGTYTIVMAGVGPIIASMKARDFLTQAWQRAEEATKAKARFLAAMSHEVRTPMNGVVGMVDLLMKTRLDGDQRVMLQTVKDSGHSLLTVINDILDFSKIEADRLDLESVDVSIVRIVEDVGVSLSPSATQKKLRLITFADPNLPAAVIGDPVRLRQILTNLAGNAVKFSSKGEVEIRAESLSADEHTVNVRFVVADEGPGMTEATQMRIFEEFSQASSATTREFGGTGLGLAICQRLIKLMNGTLEVHSEVGKGTKFICTLPFGRSQDASELVPATDLAGVKVILVNASTAIADMVRAYLGHWRASVVSVHDPESADQALKVTAASEHQTTIIAFMDIKDFDWFSSSALPIDVRIIAGKAPGQKIKQTGAFKDVTYFDTNPIRRAGLVTAVAVAAGRASPEVAYVEEPDDIEIIEPISREEAAKLGRLVLVAEDHPANREVIRRQLARLGFVCDIAENGDAALALWRAQPYSVVLTDCHMPVLDGFGLTAAIRAEETERGTHQPIVAITANALQGESERCLAAGMDAFLTKPVELRVMQDVLSRWVSNKSSYVSAAATESSPSEISAADSPHPNVLNLRPMTEAFGKIDDAARDMFQMFVETIVPALSTLHECIAAGDALGARESAHSVKSAATNAGAEEFAALLGEIEVALMEGRLDDARESARDVDRSWARVAEAISAL